MRSRRIIRVARIRAAHMRTKWTADAIRIVIKSELIPQHVLCIRTDSSDSLRLRRQQRVPRHLPPNHLLCEILPLRSVPIHLRVDELPKAPHILLDLPDYQIGPVTTYIFEPRHIFRGRQIANLLRHDGRPAGVFAIFVGIAKDKLTEHAHIFVGELIDCDVSSSLPIKLWLANTIYETKRLNPTHVSCRKASQEFESRCLQTIFDCALPLAHLTPLCIDHGD